LKEVVEYLLAILIILSFIPLYNMLSTTYYVPRVEMGAESVSYSFEEALKYVLLYGFSVGNYTQGIAEVGNALNSTLASYLSPFAQAGYGVYARVHTPIQYINVTPYSSVNILSIYNLTTIALLVDKSGRNALVASPVFDGVTPEGLYKFKLMLFNLTVKDPGVVIVVQEHRNSRFIATWIAPGMVSGQPLNIDGLTVVAPTVNLSPVTVPGFSETIHNASIFYYTPPRFGQYASSTYNITEWIEFGSGGTVLRRFYNITTIAYYASRRGWNATHTAYKLLNIRVDVRREYDRGRGDFIRGSYVYSSSLTPPLYNLVLVSIYDNKTSLFFPVYPNEWVFGDTPPLSANTRYSTMRIGMFDYLIEIRVWKR
jgi:hypothetical protein